MKKKAVHIHIFEKRILVSLIVLIAFLAGMYGFLLSSSVVNVLIREETEQKIMVMYSNMSDIESKYLTQKNHITLSLAYKLGFTDIQNKTFVTRASLLRKGLTFNQ